MQELARINRIDNIMQRLIKSPLGSGTWADPYPAAERYDQGLMTFFMPAAALLGKIVSAGKSGLLRRCEAERTAVQSQLLMAGRSLVAAVGLASAVHGELLPAARRVDWTANVAVGVPGGIPNRTKLVDVTLAPYHADKTGATNASAAIQAAVNAAKAGDVVFLPAGIYRIDTPVYIGPDKDGISVRGAGMEATVLDVRTNTAFSVGSGSDYQWAWPASGNEISSGLSKGSSSLTIANTSAFSVGQIIKISFENVISDELILAGYVPTVSVGGYNRIRNQKARITGKTGTTLSFSPSLHYAPPAGLSGRVNVAQLQCDFVGIEELCIDGAKGSMIFPIIYDQCFGCWIRSVKIMNTNNYGVFLTDSLNCEIRACLIRDRKTGGSNGAGILFGCVSSSLIEDNIVLDVAPAVEVNSSSTGNVFAYNFLECPVGGALNTNHGPHNSFNLYEGNVTRSIQSDGYFGGASEDTFFRNWIHGTNFGRTLRTSKVSLNRFTRNYSFIGNIIGDPGSGGEPYSFGNPNMGNSMFDGTARPKSGQFWRDWKAKGTLTVRASDTAGTFTLTGGTFFVGQLGYLLWENKRVQFNVTSVGSNGIAFSGGIGNALPEVGTECSVFMGPSG
ncbi:MAG TPA: glycosyl hydrolase family 28-related protein, partial [Opitutaceae bacterium]|nr:glycosyl hydrolase family 28-related protein [Opitutaceae bacterium]